MSPRAEPQHVALRTSKRSYLIKNDPQNTIGRQNLPARRKLNDSFYGKAHYTSTVPAEVNGPFRAEGHEGDLLTYPGLSAWAGITGLTGRLNVGRNACDPRVITLRPV